MCAKPVGNGVQFACRVPGKDHDGPCMAPEVGPSTVARARWEREQAADRSVATVAVTPPTEPLAVTADGTVEESATEPAASQDGNIFRSHEYRRQQALDSLRVAPESLPPAIQSWMMGAAAQIALVELWHVWKQVRQGGAVELVLTPEQIEQLVPPSLRV